MEIRYDQDMDRWKEKKMKKQNKNQIGYYNYTVILTYCGMLFAFAGILQTIKGLYWNGILCLLVAGLCDMFDGAVAATKERSTAEKRFGIQIDSLSDLVSFGVMPGIFVFLYAGGNMVSGITAGGYVLCALIRLAYFNVLEEERQETETGRRKSYLGVPVTTIALVLPAVFLLYETAVIKGDIWMDVMLLVMAAGFIAPLEIRKPEAAGKVCLLAAGALEAAAMVFTLRIHRG